MLMGVCGGIGEYFEIDSNVIRVAAILLGVLSAGVIVIAYLLSAIIIPVAE